MTRNRQASGTLMAVVMIVSMVAMVSFASAPVAAGGEDDYDAFKYTKKGAAAGGAGGATIGRLLDISNGPGDAPAPERGSRSLGAKGGAAVGTVAGGAIGLQIDWARNWWDAFTTMAECMGTGAYMDLSTERCGLY